MENELEICKKHNRSLWKTKWEHFAFLKGNKQYTKNAPAEEIEIYGKHARNVWETK